MSDILIIAIGFFVMIQLLNGIVNIITARHLKKITTAQMEIRSEENILQSEQWQSVTLKLDDIVDYLNDAEHHRQVNFQYIMDVLEDIPLPPKANNIRKPYGPRKKKAIEHKKTPPEN